MTDNRQPSSVKGFRNVVALGFVSFFTDVSSEMVFSVLPIFVVKELGATKLILGFIEGLGEATGYIFRMFSGVISDRLGKRKVLVFAGYASSTVVKPFFSVAQSWFDALVIRLGDRVGKGIRTAPRDALLSESVSESRIGRAFGLHRTLDQLGAIVGPALAFLLIPLIGTRSVFWVSFIPGFIALIILIFLVEEKVSQRRRGVSVLGNIADVLQRKFTLLLLLVTMFSMGAFNFSFILVRAGELGIPEALIPIIYAVINVAHTVMGVPTGLLSDRVGRERALLLGYGAFTLTCLLLITLGGNPLYALLIAAVYGVYVGVVETAQRALIPSYAQVNLRATAFGVYNLFVGLALLAANVVVGALWDNLGMQAAFTYSLVLSVAAIIGMMIFIKQTKD